MNICTKWPSHGPREQADVTLLHRLQSRAQAAYIESLVTGEYKDLLEEAAADSGSNAGKHLLQRIAAAVAITSDLVTRLGPVLISKLHQALPTVTVGEVDLGAGSTTKAQLPTTSFAPAWSAPSAVPKTPAVSVLVQGEKCPACAETVPFAPSPESGLLAHAVCVRGHRWGECGTTIQ